MPASGPHVPLGVDHGALEAEGNREEPAYRRGEPRLRDDEGVSQNTNMACGGGDVTAETPFSGTQKITWR